MERAVADGALQIRIVEIHEDSRGTYGVRLIQAECECVASACRD